MAKKRVTKKVLESAKKKLVELSKNWTDDVTMGRAWDLEGNEIGGNGYTACHAWVAHMFQKHCGYGSTFNYAGSYSKEAVNFLVLSCHSKTRSKGICSPEAHEAIVLWMASDDCPLSQYILNRKDTDSLLNGGIVILCGPDGASLAEAMWMCKVLRYGVEGSKALDTWKALYDAGVAPMLALLVASYVRSVQATGFRFTGVENHSTVFRKGDNYTEVNGGDLTELIAPVSRPFAKNTATLFFSGAAPPKGKSIINVETKLRGFCKPVKVSDGWGGTVDASASNKKSFIEDVLAWQRELDPNFSPSENLDVEMNNASAD